MELYDVVIKLIGPIYPVGETREDDRRFENLKTMTALVDKLISDIDIVANANKSRHEASMKRAGVFADKFLDALGIQ